MGQQNGGTCGCRTGTELSDIKHQQDPPHVLPRSLGMAENSWGVKHQGNRRMGNLNSDP